MEGVLYWSDNVCVDDPALILQCPYQPQPNVSASDTSCDCLDATMPSELITSLGLDLTTYADYGRQCGPHDADVCDKTYPSADHAMWWLHILVLGLCNLPNCTCFDGMARLLLESGEMRVKCRSRLRLQVGVTLWMSRPTPSWYLWWKGELCSRLWQQLRSLGQNRLPDGVGKWPQLGCHLCWQWILAANCLQLKVRNDLKSL